MDPKILVDGVASFPVWSTGLLLLMFFFFFFLFGLLSLFASLVFSFTLCPSLFKCSPFNLCGKLGFAIDLQRGIIVPCEPWGQNAREEEQGDNKQFLCVSRWTLMWKRKRQRMRTAVEAFNISTWEGIKQAKTLVSASALNYLAVH